MAVHCSVFIATSLDGFIAREDGGLDWLDQANAGVPPGEDCGYSEFMASVDALVMGRHTFEKVLGFPEWPYADKPVWVLSRTLQTLPTGLPPSVRLLNATPAEVDDCRKRIEALGLRMRLDADVERGQLRGEVAADILGLAAVAQQELDHLLVAPAALHQLQGRDAEA